MNIAGKVNVSTACRGREAVYQHTAVLKYTSAYPVLSSREYSRQAGRINRYYSFLSGEFIRYCEQTLLPGAIEDYKNNMVSGYPAHKYEAERSFGVTYNRNCLLSLFTDRYEYLGGAHGAKARSSDTWDIRLGHRLLLKELFPGNNCYAQDIQFEIIRQIEEQAEEDEGMYFDNYPRLVKETFNPSSFYLTEEGLAVYFQEYDIAPYASGTATFIIPYEPLRIRLPGC